MTILREDVERDYPDLDLREREELPTSPDCSFLRCQIGRSGVNGRGEVIFHLMACGRTWGHALEVLKKRRK